MLNPSLCCLECGGWGWGLQLFRFFGLAFICVFIGSDGVFPPEIGRLSTKFVYSGQGKGFSFGFTFFSSSSFLFSIQWTSTKFLLVCVIYMWLYFEDFFL